MLGLAGLFTGLKFQSTPLGRGATGITYFGGRRFYVSIHAPREGGDRSAPPCRRARPVSIHAPREGGDQMMVP